LKKKDIIKRLFHLAENKKHEGSFRRICAEALSKLEEKEGAVDILADLYLAEKNKYSLDARIIYDSLWELTAEERIEEKRKKCTGQVEFKRKYLFPYLNF
jgi:hypothetical protein